MCARLVLFTMLASFLGPRLRGDHHVNKAAMVSLDGLLLGTEQALMQFPLKLFDVAVVINVYCCLRG